MNYIKSCLIITMLLGALYSVECEEWNAEHGTNTGILYNCDCNEDTWQEYYNSEGHNMQGCWLDEADLAGANLQGANLSEALLVAANLQGANLSGADLSFAILHMANLSFADLAGANLQGANFYFTNLCNLTGSAGSECEQPEGITDENGDGYDDVSYEAGYIARHSDGVVFGMESVDITIDNQAVCEDCYADGEASVDTNSDGLVDEFPVITVLGDDVLIFTQTSDEDYTDYGASCYDGENNISQDVQVSGQVVNFNLISSYTLYYDCADSDGNQAITESRTVVVQADYSDEDDDGYDDDSYDAGAESVDVGDMNDDGENNVIDVVMLVDNILNP